METTRLYIVRAEYAGDVSLHIFFSDGTSQTVDFKPFILAHPHPQYNRYIEPKNFKKFRSLVNKNGSQVLKQPIIYCVFRRNVGQVVR